MQHQAIILNKYKYSESSLILKLLSRQEGVLTALFRGALKKKAIPEVGQQIDVELTRKGSDGMFVLRNFEEYNPVTFDASLVKTALRDTVFELLLSSLQEEDPQLELYKTTVKLLRYTEISKETSAPYILWLFLIRLHSSLGFRISLTNCFRCNAPLTSGAIFAPSKEGLLCHICSRNQIDFPPEILELLNHGSKEPELIVQQLSSYHVKTITSLLSTSLRTHCHIEKQWNALPFFLSLI